MATIQNFHKNSYLENSCNASYIALTPTKNGAKELKGFRPISLIENGYKIIPKCLTEIEKSDGQAGA